MQEFFIFVVNSTEMAHVIFDNDVIDVYFPLILKQYSLYSLSLLKKLLLQKTKLGIQCFKFSHSKYLNQILAILVCSPILKYIVRDILGGT